MSTKNALVCFGASFGKYIENSNLVEYGFSCTIADNESLKPSIDHFFWSEINKPSPEEDNNFLCYPSSRVIRIKQI